MGLRKIFEICEKIIHEIMIIFIMPSMLLVIITIIIISVII